MTTIDGLFEQIIHSEQAAQKRKTLLQELRQNVHLSQEKLTSLQKECKDLHRKHGRKLSELSDKELHSKWLASQQKIYIQQKEDLQKQLDALNVKERELKERANEDKIQFCEEMSQFSCDYDLRGHGRQRREEAWSLQLSDLVQEEEKLKQSIKLYEERQKVVDKLCEQKQSLQTQLDRILLDNSKKSSSLCEELQRTTNMEAERLTVTNQPQADDKFISLQVDLDQEKAMGVDLEDKCIKLQEQLQQLQQQLWQKQVQLRHKQLHVQPSQQLHQHKDQTETDMSEYSGEAMGEIFSDSDDFPDEDGGSKSESTTTRLPNSRKYIFRPKKTKSDSTQ